MDHTTAGGAPAYKGPSSAQGSRTAESDAGRVKVAVAVGGLFALSAVGASAAFVAEEMAPVAEPPVAAVALPPAGGGAALPQPPTTSTGLTPPLASPLVGELPANASTSGQRTGSVPVQNLAPGTTPPTGLRLGSIAVPVPVRVLGVAPPVPSSPAQPSTPVGSGARPTTSLPTVTVSLFAAGVNEVTKNTVPDRAAVPMVVVGRAHGSPFDTGTSAVLPSQASAAANAAASHPDSARPAVVAAALTDSKVAAPEAPATKGPGPTVATTPSVAAGPEGKAADEERPARDVRPAGQSQVSVWGAAVTRPGPVVGPAHGRDHGDGPSH